MRVVPVGGDDPNPEEAKIPVHFSVQTHLSRQLQSEEAVKELGFGQNESISKAYADQIRNIGWAHRDLIEASKEAATVQDLKASRNRKFISMLPSYEVYMAGLLEKLKPKFGSDPAFQLLTVDDFISPANREDIDKLNHTVKEMKDIAALPDSFREKDPQKREALQKRMMALFDELTELVKKKG